MRLPELGILQFFLKMTVAFLVKYDKMKASREERIA